MIQNERQYKVSQTKLRELEQAFINLNLSDPNLHPRQLLSQQKSYERLISSLKQEIAEYEELKSGAVNTLQIEDINDLPIALIKARIASGMTQKDLAEKVGTQEQQIQRYEADRYAAISFERMMRIAAVLAINFKGTMEIAIAPPF